MSQKLKASELKDGLQRELLRVNTELLKSEQLRKDLIANNEDLRVKLWEAEAEIDMRNRWTVSDLLIPALVAAIFFFIGVLYDIQ